MFGKNLMIDAHSWLPVAKQGFADIDFGDDVTPTTGFLVCEDLAYAADEAHGIPENQEFLNRC